MGGAGGGRCSVCRGAALSKRGARFLVLAGGGAGVPLWSGKEVIGVNCLASHLLKIMKLRKADVVEDRYNLLGIDTQGAH